MRTFIILGGLQGRRCNSGTPQASLPPPPPILSPLRDLRRQLRTEQGHSQSSEHGKGDEGLGSHVTGRTLSK